MKPKHQLDPAETYANLLRLARLPLSAVGAERLARILRYNFGARPITTVQFHAALHRYHAGIESAEEQYGTADPDEAQRQDYRTHADYRSLTNKDKLALCYRIAEGQSAAEIARELCLSPETVFRVTSNTRAIMETIAPQKGAAGGQHSPSRSGRTRPPEKTKHRS